ncbi:hypothetical protein [Chitinophaga sp. sic0106]|uniref:hypothetical protein n=1 Tax=Chitinophaga sp. sic0106 TaxID=2854785 RepID=UPI001C496229|nr:hypothetical protein [Chitinophaga sp. sic0106]MBV7529875.1 hypothetical protein [Chitinophaga sp. sic0106]
MTPLFKVQLPTGYYITDIFDDCIDANIILPNNLVYVASFYTLKKVQSLMENDESPYFADPDMILTRDLKKSTIKKAIRTMVEEESIASLCSKIGTIQKIYRLSGYTSFKDVVDDLADVEEE